MKLSPTFSICMQWLYTFFPLNKGILKIICLLSIYKSWPGTESFLFVFPRVLHWNAVVCVSTLNPAESDWLAGGSCKLSAKVHTCHSQGCSWEWGEVCRALKVCIGQWEGSPCQASQAAYLKAFLMGSMKGILESVTLRWVLSFDI